MQQTVYGDLLFLINFSMDFLCLFLVAKLLSRPMSPFRFVLAATSGGIYSVISLFLPQGLLLSLVDLLFCAVICSAAFARRGESWRSLLTLCVMYFLSSVLLGGIMTAIFALLNRLSPPLDDLEKSTDIPPWILIAVALLSAFTSLLGGRFLHRKAGQKTLHLEVRLGGRRASCLAFCDSGHLLRDPLDGRCVILLDKSLAPLLLPADKKGFDLSELQNTESLARRVRIIPLKTANAESVLYALRPDRILLKDDKQTHTVDALVGFTEFGGALDECKALIPPELVI
ncbi:MAG: sigma-E processing peptidase SpoIIGA [Clostridia bacterium]|nr:sigma-E processing peptidase SpoIIGA [Clostridia bacterium]